MNCLGDPILPLWQRDSNSLATAASLSNGRASDQSYSCRVAAAASADGGTAEQQGGAEGSGAAGAPVTAGTAPRGSHPGRVSHPSSSRKQSKQGDVASAQSAVGLPGSRRGSEVEARATGAASGVRRRASQDGSRPGADEPAPEGSDGGVGGAAEVTRECRAPADTPENLPADYPEWWHDAPARLPVPALTLVRVLPSHSAA